MSDLSMPEVQYVQQSLKKSTLTLLWQEWQTSQKAWCRTLIQAIHEAFRSCRRDSLRGTIRTSELDIVLLEWSHEVVKRITASCTLRRITFEEDMLEQDNWIRLFSHLSSEILMFAVRDVYVCLQTCDCVALADVILQSHHVMTAVEQAADCIIYLINKDRQEMCAGFRYLDLGQDLVDIRDQFLQMSFHLTVIHSDVTWAYFVMLVRDHERAGLMLDSSLERLSEYVKAQLASESVEDVIIKKLCHAAENEAKQEVWQDYSSQENLYTSILIKQQVIKKLTHMIKENIQKKADFDKRYDLLPERPKTRIEKLVEKRKQIVDKVNAKLKNQATPKVLSSEINKVEVKIVSDTLERYTETLTYIREKLQRKWKREGMKGCMPGGKYLAQALLHPHINVEGEQKGKYRFKNYLHLKRCETFLRQYLESVVMEMVGMMLYVLVDDNRLRTAQLDDKHKDRAVTDLLTNVDTLAIVLTQDLHGMAHDIIDQEASLTSLDMEMVKQSCQQLMKKSSILGNRNNSAIPIPANEEIETNNEMKRVGETSTQRVNQEKNAYPQCSEQSISHAETGKDNCNSEAGVSDTEATKHENESVKKVDVVENCEDSKTDLTAREISFSELIKDLQPLRLYMKFVQTRESMKSCWTQISYLNRQKKKRDYAQSVYINNMIDSYYLIHEGDDSHIFTKAGRYQLEHDLTGESSKPLPKCIKSFVLCMMLLLIVISGSYVTMIGRQFSTTQAQEWVCFYLLSILLFGFVFEPIRAVMLGRVLQRV